MLLPNPQVADLCVEALLLDEAQNKVVEVITDQSAPMMPPRALLLQYFDSLSLCCLATHDAFHTTMQRHL